MNAKAVVPTTEQWQRLREARRRAGITQQRVADWFGLSREAISLWETPDARRRTRPSAEQLARFARETGAPLEDYLLNDRAPLNAVWLSAGEGGGIRPLGPEDQASDEEVRIPESRVKFSGGPGHLMSYEVADDREPAFYRRSWFQKERINPKKTMRFRVTGRSMEPLLYPDDSILVNLEETQVREGLVYVFRQGDELKVKKLIPKSDGSLVLRSINRDEYPDDVVPADQVAELITVIGRVRDKSGRGGL
jgi:transcriptional regulator with XRE-family HTH domain